MMQDSPSASELLEAIGDFLEQDIMPEHSGRAAFQVRIAVSLCRILAREVRLEPGFLALEAATLGALFGEPGPTGPADPAKVRDLAARLTAVLREHGPLPMDRDAVFDAAAELVRHKLLVVNPEYLDQPVEEAVR